MQLISLAHGHRDPPGLNAHVGPATHSDLPFSQFLLPAPQPPQPRSPSSPGWRGHSRERIRLARSLDMIPECALEAHLAASCLEMEGRD